MVISRELNGAVRCANHFVTLSCGDRLLVSERSKIMFAYIQGWAHCLRIHGNPELADEVNTWLAEEFLTRGYAAVVKVIEG